MHNHDHQKFGEVGGRVLFWGSPRVGLSVCLCVCGSITQNCPIYFKYKIPKCANSGAGVPDVPGTADFLVLKVSSA